MVELGPPAVLTGLSPLLPPAHVCCSPHAEFCQRPHWSTLLLWPAAAHRGSRGWRRTWVQGRR